MPLGISLNHMRDEGDAGFSVVGRDRELEWLADRLGIPTRQPVIVAGAAGSGKTALVRAFFARYSREPSPRDYPAPLWLDVAPQSTAATLVEAARALHSARWDALSSAVRSRTRTTVVIDGFNALPPPDVFERAVDELFNMKLVGSVLLTTRELPTNKNYVLVLEPPEPGGYGGLLLQTVVTLGPKVPEGQLVQAVALPWFEIIETLDRNPGAIHQLDWRKWEEIIAGAYQQAGFEVILTPRSNDKGRDVIATRPGIGSIRFIDQVKAYAPGHLVKADDVRALLGALTLDPNVSKGILTTTSDFAPGIKTDPQIAGFMPYRLELKGRDALLAWLKALAKRT